MSENINYVSSPIDYENIYAKYERIRATQKEGSPDYLIMLSTNIYSSSMSDLIKSSEMFSEKNVTLMVVSENKIRCILSNTLIKDKYDIIDVIMYVNSYFYRDYICEEVFNQKVEETIRSFENSEKYIRF